MKVLVTGGCGFIGSHVVEELLASGHEVRVLDDLSTSQPRAETLDGHVELVPGDVRDADVVDRCLDGVDAVSHQAAKVGLTSGLTDLPDYVARNDFGTAVLVAQMAAADVMRLVLASSMVVYGEGAYDCDQHGRVRPGPRSHDDLTGGNFEPRCPQCGLGLSSADVDEGAAVDPRNGYAASKVAQEHLAATWARVTGGAAIALRYHNVYGPRLPRNTPYAGVAALFRSALASGEAPRVFEDGRQRRDFVHVRDVARANVLALEAAPPGARLTAYNIASGHPTTVGDMASALAEAVGGPRPVVTGEFRLGDVRHVVASAQRARAGLGFQSQISLAAGLAEFAAEDGDRYHTSRTNA